MTSGRWSRSDWRGGLAARFARHVRLVVVVWTVLAASGGAAWAQSAAGQVGDNPLEIALEETLESKELNTRVEEAWREFLVSWQAFAEWKLLLTLLVALLLSVALASLIAYHPSSYGKAQTFSDMEAPKTYIIYAIVGAVCGQLIAIDSRIGFALFGLGGLMRFRTDVGATKETGRVIMVTVVGLCCGYNQPAVGVFATALTWIFIYFMERNVVHRMMIKGLTSDKLVEAEKVHLDLLEENHCAIVHVKKNFTKAQIAVTLRSPHLDTDDIDALIAEHVPEDLRGAIDWQTR